MVRAVEIHKTGPPDVLKLTNDYKKPKIVSGQVFDCAHSPVCKRSPANDPVDPLS